MLNRHIHSIQKWYITCITAPLGTAHHAATTQPIPFIQIAIAIGLRTTPKWKCRHSDKTPVSPKRRHPRPELISLQASLSSLVGNDILPIAPLHTFQSILFISITHYSMKRSIPVLALGRKFPGTGANSGPARPSGTRSATMDRHMRKYKNG